MEKRSKYTTTLDKLINGAPNIKIDSLFTDSRKHVENGIFFCVKGLVNDGHKYVKDAISNGAVCIVYSDDLASYDDQVYYLKVEDVLESLNNIAAAFYHYPSQNLEIFAVTGTNGKTTASSILKNILDKFKKTGYIGTINIEYDNKSIRTNHTTPDVLELQKVLADMVEAGVEAVAIEVSSHALEQKRVLALEVDYAMYTNLSHDHLDYHGNMDNYFLAKSKLFSSLLNKAKGIVNIDDGYGSKMIDKCSTTTVTYAIDQSADYQAVDVEYFKDKTKFKLLYKNKSYDVETSLVAKFNIYNLLAVIAALSESGIEINDVISSLSHINQVDGRVEKIDLGQPFTTIIDYAHTPDSFDKILSYASEIKGDKRIITVFGSAGERDILKRKMLGEVANKYCDMIILTEDDPRKEDVREICEEIAQGIDKNYIIIENRYDAIYQAVELANSEDVILILGKGNDQYMARYNGKEFYPGDGEVAKKAIKEYLSGLQEEEYYE